MSATLREIVDDTLNVLGEVAGAGVATYSEDRMMADAVRTFNLLFKKYYWPNMLEWFRVPLDGTLGIVPAETFKHVRDIEDFYSVFRDGNASPLPSIPKGINPFSITGTAIQYYGFQPVTSENYENRYLQIWPKSATGYINVLARVYPRENGERWKWDDDVPLDKDMMVNGTAFLTLSTDDINPGAADAQRNMMEMRYKDILAAFANSPMAVRRGGSSVPNDWFMAP